MKIIFVLFCLGLMGCATVTKENKTPPQIVEKTIEVNEKEMDSIISVFSEVIKKTPDYAGAYYNRAIAYFYKKDYEKSWQDVHIAESLGCKFSADFIKSLKDASHREK